MREYLYLPNAVPLPREYLTLYLCRDVFHCTPLELRAQSFADVRAALTCLSAEAEHNKARH